VNDQNHDPERSVVLPGYHHLRRAWQPGEEITLHLDLTPRWTYPDRRIDAARGCAAIERGPLAYCFEQADGIQLGDLAVLPRRRPDQGRVPYRCSNASWSRRS
jgi:DUF1680 family protein